MTESIVIEQNGVTFETLVPERIWSIPQNKSGAETPVKFGSRITNKSQKYIRFCIFRMFSPTLIGLNGKHLRPEGGSNASRIIREFDCPFVSSGEDLTFFLDGKLTWHDNELWLEGLWEPGGRWFFRDIKPGTYGFYFRYTCYPEKGRLSLAIREIWKDIWAGKVETPVIEISLVMPHN